MHIVKIEVGVICSEIDFPKLNARIRENASYEDQGYIGRRGCQVRNLVPPPESADRIGRRLVLREQILYSRLKR